MRASLVVDQQSNLAHAGRHVCRELLHRRGIDAARRAAIEIEPDQRRAACRPRRPPPPASSARRSWRHGHGSDPHADHAGDRRRPARRPGRIAARDLEQGGDEQHGERRDLGEADNRNRMPLTTNAPIMNGSRISARADASDTRIAARDGPGLLQATSADRPRSTASTAGDAHPTSTVPMNDRDHDDLPDDPPGSNAGMLITVTTKLRHQHQRDEGHQIAPTCDQPILRPMPTAAIGPSSDEPQPIDGDDGIGGQQDQEHDDHPAQRARRQHAVRIGCRIGGAGRSPRGDRVHGLDENAEIVLAVTGSRRSTAGPEPSRGAARHPSAATSAGRRCDQQEDRNRLRPRRIHQAGTPAISAAMRRAASAGSAAPVIGRPITM